MPDYKTLIVQLVNASYNAKKLEILYRIVNRYLAE